MHLTIWSDGIISGRWSRCSNISSLVIISYVSLFAVHYHATVPHCRTLRESEKADEIREGCVKSGTPVHVICCNFRSSPNFHRNRDKPPKHTPNPRARGRDNQLQNVPAHIQDVYKFYCPLLPRINNTQNICALYT